MTSERHPSHRRWRPDREGGAALVEMAIVTPLLVLLLLGIVEFGWLFGQYNDVRHGAREGARYAAVNAGGNAAIRDYICDSMDGLTAGMTSITLDLAQTETNGVSGIQLGDEGTVTVTATVGSLSNAPLISSFLPSALSSSVDFRLEQDPDAWTPTTGLTCP